MARPSAAAVGGPWAGARHPPCWHRGSPPWRGSGGLGRGRAGIGKSSLAAEALAGAGALGWDIGWGIANRLAERLPLSVMQDCLQVRLSSRDPRRARAAGLLRSRRLGLFADRDASVSGVEVLMALADELCGRPDGDGDR